MLSLSTARDSVRPVAWIPGSSSEPPPPEVLAGGVALKQGRRDSVWTRLSGWAKAAVSRTGQSCRSGLRQSGVCHMLAVDVAANATMRAVSTRELGSPPWPEHRVVVRPARIPGVAVLQRCDPNACGVGFP